MVSCSRSADPLCGDGAAVPDLSGTTEHYPRSCRRRHDPARQTSPIINRMRVTYACSRRTSRRKSAETTKLAWDAVGSEFASPTNMKSSMQARLHREAWFLWNFDRAAGPFGIESFRRLRHEWAALTSARSPNRPTYCWGGREVFRDIARVDPQLNASPGPNCGSSTGQTMRWKSQEIGRTIGAPNSAERLLSLRRLDAKSDVAGRTGEFKRIVSRRVGSSQRNGSGCSTIPPPWTVCH